MRIIAYGEETPHNFTYEFYNLMNSKSIGAALLSHKEVLHYVRESGFIVFVTVNYVCIVSLQTSTENIFTN